MTDEERNATRRFSRYVAKRRRLAAEHRDVGHPRPVTDCPGCEGHDVEAALRPPELNTKSNP